jgi:xylan 1,4-beta-xylosidase
MRAERSVSVLVWNYQDNDVTGPAAHIDLSTAGLLRDVRRVRIRHYRIDEQHCNASAAWKRIGSPPNPAPEQKARLAAAGQLEMLGSPV